MGSENVNTLIAIVVVVIVAVAVMGTYYIATREKVEEGAPETVTISGIIIYDNYSQGEILIGAYENIYLIPPGSIIGVEPLEQSIGAVSIWTPSAYSFTVPANSGQMWISAINDANDLAAGRLVLADRFRMPMMRVIWTPLACD